MTVEYQGLNRGLQARHIELVTLSSIIGIGLFMEVASTLQWPGSSVLLAYIITAIFVFFIMRAMIEYAIWSRSPALSLSTPTVLYQPPLF